ncbi:hypothetical protein [Leifsonia aquatica]|uniref:hypothetical protein n=1 Tax=Leifsonia aquatica TaxID=144185 RepID=UPI00046A03C1|nr:hypothetical protein [Leifsonia aquatica]
MNAHTHELSGGPAERPQTDPLGTDGAPSTLHPERRRRTAPEATITIVVFTVILLTVPAASALDSLRLLAGYGWLGPYDNDMAALNAGESLFKTEISGVLVLLGLAASAIMTGFVARSAGMRVTRVVLLATGCAVVAMAALALAVTWKP